MRTLATAALILCTLALATVLAVFRPESHTAAARPLAGRWVTDHAATIDAMRGAHESLRTESGEPNGLADQEAALFAFADRFAGGLEVTIDLRIDFTCEVAVGIGEPWFPGRSRWRVNTAGMVELYDGQAVRAVLRVEGEHLVLTDEANAGRPGLVLRRGS